MQDQPPHAPTQPADQQWTAHVSEADGFPLHTRLRAAFSPLAADRRYPHSAVIRIHFERPTHTGAADEQELLALQRFEDELLALFATDRTTLLVAVTTAPGSRTFRVYTSLYNWGEHWIPRIAPLLGNWEAEVEGGPDPEWNHFRALMPRSTPGDR